MSSKSSNDIPSLKRKIPTHSISIKQIKIELKSQRHYQYSNDDIIRSRLLYEGDQGNDDRRISTLLKIFNKSMLNISSLEIDKLLSIIYSIKHSYHLLKLTREMDEREQINYIKKLKQMSEQIKQLRNEVMHSEQCLIEAKKRRLNLLEYDERTDIINKLSTKKELRTQQVITLERKRYFEHLQQTFEATYQQRLKQIAIYMRPIFKLDEILQEDAHEDGLNEYSTEQQTTPTTPILLKTKNERPRTFSDSSITSIDGDDNISTVRSKKQQNKTHLNMISLSTSLIHNEPKPLFSNDIELYGTQLVNPLLFLSSPLNN